MVHMECWKEPVLWCCGVIKINKRKQQTNSIKCVMCTRSLFIMWSIQNEIVQTVFFYTGTFYVTTARHFLYHVRKFWMRNSSCFCSKIFDVHFSPDFNKMFVDKQAVSITVASKHAHQLFRCSVFIERAWLIILDIKPLDIHFYYDVTPFTNLRVLMLWLLDEFRGWICVWLLTHCQDREWNFLKPLSENPIFGIFLVLLSSVWLFLRNIGDFGNLVENIGGFVPNIGGLEPFLTEDQLTKRSTQ